MISSSVARRYAQALLDVGIEMSSVEKFSEELTRMAELFGEHPELVKVLANQTLSLKERKEVLEKVLSRVKGSEFFRHFLLLLLDKQRIGFFPTIVDEYQRLAEESSSEVHVTLTSAFPLAEKTRQIISQELGKKTGKQVTIEVKEDASLIGGMVTKIGDLVFDGSVATQLESLKRQMMEGGRKHGN